MPKLTNEAKLLKAVGDGTRLHLIRTLMTKPQYISQLADGLKMDRATISYNLSVLEDAGILQSDYVILDKPHSKGKAAHVYSVNIPRLKDALALFRLLDKS